MDIVLFSLFTIVLVLTIAAGMFALGNDMDHQTNYENVGIRPTTVVIIGFSIFLLTCLFGRQTYIDIIESRQKAEVDAIVKLYELETTNRRERLLEERWGHGLPPENKYAIMGYEVVGRIAKIVRETQGTTAALKSKATDTVDKNWVEK